MTTDVATAVTQNGEQATNPWLLPLLAIELVRAQPRLCNGIWLKSGAGAAKDAWWQVARQRWSGVEKLKRVQRIPSSVTLGRLVGEVDITASVLSGKRQHAPGLLQSAAGGIAVVAMAERLDASNAAVMAQVLDGCAGLGEALSGGGGDGGVAGGDERPLIVLEDESEPGERGAPISLTSRVGIVISLPASLKGLGDARDEIAQRLQIETANLSQAENEDASVVASTRGVSVADSVIGSAAELAQACGVDDSRHLRHAIDCMRAHALCRGSTAVASADAIIGAALTIAPRAVRAPQLPAEQPPPEDEIQNPPNDQSAADQPDDEPNPPPESRDDHPEEKDDPDNAAVPQQIDGDMLIQACAALLPAGLLNFNSDAARMQGMGGAAGPHKVRAAQRGRPLASRQGALRSGKRLDVYATLIAAAPWQRVRARDLIRNAGAAVQTEGAQYAHQAQHAQYANPHQRIHLRPADFRLRRFEQPCATTAIFVIDASGSAAIARLAEAKGAVELMLADCYVRRDEVAVISFRGRTAEIVVPPTRSLTRVKRSLCAMPGGGGTPLATALETAHSLAQRVARGGATPLIVLLSDGRANITREGAADRRLAQAEANEAASRIAAARVHSLVIDTSARGDAQAKLVAESMRGDYLCLPNAESRSVSEATRRAIEQIKPSSGVALGAGSNRAARAADTKGLAKHG
ncbi:MAG: VWA domain-containing protein [Burkholderiales bacterium]